MDLDHPAAAAAISADVSPIKCDRNSHGWVDLNAASQRGERLPLSTEEETHVCVAGSISLCYQGHRVV